jgi:hypothetical protein
MNPQDSQIHFWIVVADASIAPKYSETHE